MRCGNRPQACYVAPLTLHSCPTIVINGPGMRAYRYRERASIRIAMGARRKDMREFLNREIFYSMKEFRVLAERWRVHHNGLQAALFTGLQTLGARSLANLNKNVGHAKVESQQRFPLLGTSLRLSIFTDNCAPLTIQPASLPPQPLQAVRSFIDHNAIAVHHSTNSPRRIKPSAQKTRSTACGDLHDATRPYKRTHRSDCQT